MSRSQASDKIKHVWTVLCERSMIDGDSNNISLINVLEQLTISLPSPEECKSAKAAEIGVVPIHHEIVSLWTRAKEDEPALGHARVTLFSPGGRLADPVEIQVDLRKYQRTRSRQRFEGLPIKEAGQYLFLVEYRDDGQTDWRGVATIPLQVVIKSSPEKGT